MNLPLASIIILAYINAVWQIMLWGYDLIHPVFGFFLIIFFPVFAGIAVYLALQDRVPEAWVIPLLVSTILFPVVYGVSHLTRLPDHIKFVRTGGSVFEGNVGDINDRSQIYYTLNNADLRAAEFGASYDSTRPRQSTTTYHKYFALPVFDRETNTSPGIFVCDSIKSGLQIDNGAGGSYGLSETDIPRALDSGPLYGRTILDASCDRAARAWYKKAGKDLTERPLILEIETETAAEYYRMARIHFWAFTIALNALFITLFAFVYRANKGI